jgi:lipoyl(octanoyl) transferase
MTGTTVNPVKYTDLGVKDFKETWDLQEELFSEVLEDKRNAIQIPSKRNFLLFVEHPHVYTLGKSGSEENLLVDYLQLQASQAKFYHINRGGDITYHGPGQVVGYPIIDLEQFNLGVKDYMHLLEEVIIDTISHYGVKAGRLEGATGVWTGIEGNGSPRKLCAMGVRISRYVTMHGFALNVNTDLSYFGHINPCGFVDKGVTSLEKELGKAIPMDEVKAHLRHHFERHFQMKLLT